MVKHMLIARLAGKRHEPQAEHVKRRESRRDQRHHKQQHMAGVGRHERQRRGEDGVLRVITGERYDSGNRQARDRDTADEHRSGRVGELRSQAPHLRHLLLVMAAVNHAPRTKEEQ